MKRLVVLLLLSSTLFSACNMIQIEEPKIRSDSEISTLVARTVTAGARTGQLLTTPVAACPPAPACPPCASCPSCPAIPEQVAEVTAEPPASEIVPTPTPLPENSACALSKSGAAEIAVVMRVINPFTVEAILNGQTVQIRYLGIDMPPWGNPVEYFTSDALDKNIQMVQGKVITLIKDQTDTDQQGYLLRYVFADDRFINYELIRQGYARFTTFPQDTSCDATLTTAQQQAQTDSAGIWALAAATPPASAASSGAPCDCAGPDLDCRDFGIQPVAQTCYDYCRDAGLGDIFLIDNDQNGKACEALPKY